MRVCACRPVCSRLLNGPVASRLLTTRRPVHLVFCRPRAWHRVHPADGPAPGAFWRRQRACRRDHASSVAAHAAACRDVATQRPANLARTTTSIALALGEPCRSTVSAPLVSPCASPRSSLLQMMVAPGYPAPGYPAPGYPAPMMAPGYPAPGYPAPMMAPGYAAPPMMVVPQPAPVMVMQQPPVMVASAPVYGGVGMGMVGAAGLGMMAGMVRRRQGGEGGECTRGCGRRLREWMLRWRRRAGERGWHSLDSACAHACICPARGTGARLCARGRGRYRRPSPRRPPPHPQQRLQCVHQLHQQRIVDVCVCARCCTALHSARRLLALLMLRRECRRKRRGPPHRVYDPRTPS
jgi:hypothetical protein